MTKYDCEVIQDLIPLYQGDAASPRTKAIVDEHLRECPVCQAFFAQSSLPPVPAPVKAVPHNPEIVSYGRRVKTRRRKITLIISSILVVLLLIIAGLSVFVYRVIWGGPPSTSSDLADYGEFESSGRYSHLAIFPEELPASAQDAQYHYFYQDTFLDATYQIHLEYSLSEADYQAEVKRLAQITSAYQGETHPVVYDTTNFAYPAYVTIFANNLTYEYALLIEKEHKIVYVFTQFIDRNDIRFDPGYLPLDFQSFGDYDVDTLGGYNIYYFKDDMVGGAYMEEKEEK